MVRPCVARSFVDLVFGLASMYPASDWSGVLLRATMDISARSICLADRPRVGQRGHQVSIAPGRPVSISSLPLADLGGETLECIAATSSAAPHLVSSLVRANGRSFIPACTLDMRRAQVRSRPVRQGRPQGLALTAPSTAPGSCSLGRTTDRPRRFEASSLGKYRPGDARELVSECDRQHVVVQTFLCGLDPRLEPVPLPALRLDENDPRCLHEQHAQIAISPLRYLAQDRAISRRDLLRHQPEPSREVAPLREHVARADCGDDRARDDGADPRPAHEAIATRILSGNRFDLARQSLDALIEAPPVAGEVFDDAQHARRQYVRARGENDRQLGAQEADALAHSDATLQHEGSDLVDEPRTL